MKHGAEAEKLGKTGKDAYDWKLANGGTRDEALALGQYADQRDFEDFMSYGYRDERSLEIVYTNGPSSSDPSAFTGESLLVADAGNSTTDVPPRDGVVNPSGGDDAVPLYLDRNAPPSPDSVERIAPSMPPLSFGKFFLNYAADVGLAMAKIELGGLEATLGGLAIVGAEQIPGGGYVGTALFGLGLSNFSEGVGALSNAFYGGDRDYNFLRTAASDSAEYAGFDRSVGARGYYAIDFAANLAVLLNPRWIAGVTEFRYSGGPPLAVETYKQIPYIAAEAPGQQFMDVIGIFDNAKSYGDGK